MSLQLKVKREIKETSTLLLHDIILFNKDDTFPVHACTYDILLQGIKIGIRNYCINDELNDNVKNYINAYTYV